MNQRSYIGQVGDELEHLYRHWNVRREAAESSMGSRSTGLSIGISREAGSGGSKIALAVGKELGWPVYDHQLLDRIAEDMGVRAKLLETVDEKRVGWLQQALEGAFGVPVVTEPAYIHHLVQTVHALGVHGHCVFVGRGAPFLLPRDTCLRVRLKAPLPDRMAALSKDLNLSPEDAKRRAAAIDKERRGFVHTYFRRDPNDLSQYDLVIDTSRFSVPACAQLISEALRDLQRTIDEPTGGSKR